MALLQRNPRQQWWQTQGPQGKGALRFPVPGACLQLGFEIAYWKKMYISTTSIPNIFWANKPLPPRCLHEFYGICIHPKLQSCNCGACDEEEEGECFEVSGLSESTLHDTNFDPCPADVQTKFELTPQRL